MSKDFGFRDQFQRASVSVMSNIAEGFGYKSDNQFIRFLDISRASAYELQSLLYVALDTGYIEEPIFHGLYELTEETFALIAGLQRYLRTSI